ncbi:MAG: TlpA family protein disulfide reductase [Bacteroidia bacterium]|nr:TlpA family protein disulfide reductase [Bacteroidia bacterium]
MAGVPDSAYVQLDFLVEKARFNEHKKISKEKKLKPLHGTPRWDTLLAKVKRNFIASEAAFKKSKENEKKAVSFHDSLRGKAAVPFSCTDVNGKKYELSALKGKVIVFNFWATWCGPCKMEMPELNKVKEKFKGQDVVFISFCDNVDSIAILNKNLAKNPFTYVMVIGEDARKLNKLYAVSSIPVNIVIDKNGIVTFLEAGYAPHVVTEMEHKIEKSLED